MKHRENEQDIDRQIHKAYVQAMEVIKGPFPAGEKYIARNAKTAYEYALRILQGPFPAGEPAIAREATLACDYAVHILKGPFPAGEPAIFNSPNPIITYTYVAEIIKGACPPAEDRLARDSYYATQYACYMLKKPFPAGEKAIYRDIYCAFQYEVMVLQQTLESAEARLRFWKKRHTYLNLIELHKHLKCRWPHLEDKLLKLPRLDFIFYAESYLKTLIQAGMDVSQNPVQKLYMTKNL